ncbi:cytochrome c3 family protein [Pseudomonas sp. UL073]|uniref:Cytochrome c3 family protein n=1 Tax=Zestomonas insulae TaxID=2809017 RepID=A0ABS2IIA3_9GAMM|nr:cytochrome c3 family protein [Pseudomonas insulae]MBM7062802.1 cytochrome c3 family protein [Pseudomonas insulae]
MKRALLALLLLGLFAALGYAGFAQHAAQVRQRPLLPLNFDHRPHGSVNCLTCHHDYAQKAQTPGDAPTCILCHKLTPALATQIEGDFHQLCRGCHLQRNQSLQPSGPLRPCQQCHVLPPPTAGAAPP